MAGSLNRVTLIGNVGKDPEISCSVRGRGVVLILDHHPNCDCDDCCPF